jgi:hypothetical protein
VREHAVEWARDPFEIKRLDEHDGVPLLAVPHEAVQVLLERSVAVRRLFLERPERAQLATPPREHLDRALIARAFDQDDCAQGATSCRRRSRPRARGGS